MIPTKKIERHIEEFTLVGTREADEHILNAALATFEKAGSPHTTRINPHVHNWVTKTVAAIVVIGVLIPLGYGASRMIRTLILKPVEKAELSIDFKLDKDLYAELRVGTRQQPELVHTRSIRFFVEDEQLRGTLRSVICSWPKFKWRTRIVLLDHRDRHLASTEHVNENGGIKHDGWAQWFDHSIHFTLGTCSSDLLEQVHKVSIQCEQIPANTEVTPNAWVESSILPVVHGRVTLPDGRPIANAVVQIREERKEGQRGIDAPDVYTDSQGVYCFDGIHWDYNVGVLVYTYEASGSGYCHQYKRLNRTLRGANQVDFVLEDSPQGTAVIKGRMRAPGGSAVRNFKLDIRNHVDLKNHPDEYLSKEYLYRFGFVRLFSDSEGHFEMSGLPSGKYQVVLTPTIEKTTGERFDDIVNRREYLCELTEGETIDVTQATEENKAWYGQVLFEDGSPAVLDLPGIATQILDWGQNATEGFAVATVDANGYFTALMPGKKMTELKSGEAWLTVRIGKPRFIHEQKGERFHVALLSSHREKAGVLRIIRPKVYHARILYQNGRPAVPPAVPWDGAKVWIRLRCTPATWNDGGITENLGNLDDQGSVTIILSDEQHEKIQAGEYSLEIMHPSYESERSSYPIGKFPVELLSRDRNAIKGYILPPESMAGEHRHLAQCLDSYDRLETLGTLLKKWRAKHNGEFPASLTQLNSYANEEVFTQIMDNIEYQPSGRTGLETESYLIAYDKELLEEIKGTHVLFSSGTIGFLPQRKLDTVDMNR